MHLENLSKIAAFSNLLRVRQSPYELISVANRDLDKYKSEGWQVVRRGAGRTRLRRIKTAAKFLEDRIWSILFRMGFDEISGELGALLICETNGNPIKNQLDVISIDEDCCVIVECKSAEKPRNALDLQRDLALLEQIRQQVARCVNENNQGTKRRVGAVMALWNIVPTTADLTRAAESAITIIDNAGIEYYERLLDHTGSAAKYQLLSEIFADTEIAGLEIRVPAVESRMGSIKAYTFSVTPAHLLKIAHVARRARGGSAQIEAYQRMVNRSRIKGIQEYIKDNGVFPTNIVVNFQQQRRGGSRLHFEHVQQQSRDISNVRLGWLTLPPFYQSAWIIDGQHRLLAYSGLEKADKDTVCVTAFDGLTPSEQAQMFIDINSKQKRVSGNLLTELVATLNWDSVDVDASIFSIISTSIQQLGARSTSPFFRRIKLADEKASENKCISLKSMADALRKGRFYIVRRQNKKPIEYGPFWTGESKQTLTRTCDVIDEWFNGISQHASSIWKVGRGQGGYLAMNDGVVACISTLESVMDHIGFADCQRMSTQQLKQTIAPFATIIGRHFSSLTTKELQVYRRLRGAQGQTEALHLIQAAINAEKSDFIPKDFIQWRDNQANDDETMKEAYGLVHRIESTMQRIVTQQLMSKFGNERSSWELAIPDNIREEAARRKERERRKYGDEIERYLNLIDYRDIALKYWSELFMARLAYGETGNKEKRTEWIVRLNGIRNKVMHVGTAGGKLTQEEYSFLKEITLLLDSTNVSSDDLSD